MDTTTIIAWIGVVLAMLALFERAVKIVNDVRNGKKGGQKDDIDISRGFQELTEKAVANQQITEQKLADQDKRMEDMQIELTTMKNNTGYDVHYRIYPYNNSITDVSVVPIPQKK